MKAAIYCRVSTEDQEQQGTSLKSQLDACLQYCQERGYQVTNQFQETYTGLSIDRPKLNDLRQLVRDKVADVIVIYCLDRLTRDPVHGSILQEEFEKAGTRLEAVTEVIENSDLGKLINYIRTFSAKSEALKIRERTIRGKRERAKAGRIPSGQTGKCYGYTYLAGKDKGQGIREINEEQAKVIGDIFSWFADERLKPNRITLRLDSMGVPTASDKKYWNHSTIRQILRNPAYTGKTYCFRYGHTDNGRTLKPKDEWMEIEGATPRIISDDLFNRAQKLLRENKALASRNTRREYLLSGVIFCKHCGRRYTARTAISGQGFQTPYYRCPNNIQAFSPIPCRNRQWNGRVLDNAIWGKIREMLIRPESVLTGLSVLEEDTKYIDNFTAQIKDIEGKLKYLDDEQEKLLDQSLRGFPEDMVIKENAKINRSREDLKARKSELENKILQAKTTIANMDNIENFCKLASKNIDNFSFEDKRLSLRALQIKVMVDGDNITLEGVVPDAMSIETLLPI